MDRHNQLIAFSIFLVILITPMISISVHAEDWSRTLNRVIDIFNENQRNEKQQDEEQRRRQQQYDEQRRRQQQYDEQRRRQQQYERQIHQQPLQKQYREEEAERIRYIQRMLNKLHYDAGPPDGVMGARTRKSIIAFQTDYNLEPDGNVNAILVKELTAAVQNGSGTTWTEPLAIEVNQMVTDEKSSGSITLFMGEEKRSKTATQTLYRIVLQKLGHETCKLKMSEANTALSFARIMDHGKEAESFFTRYKGWNAEDEFARSSLQSQFYEQFVEPEINIAPHLPLNMVLVYNISLLEYDKKAGGFPLQYKDMKYGNNIALPGINSVNLDIPVDRPEVFSISQEKAEKFIHSNKNRRLYLKVDATLNSIDSSDYGVLSIKGNVTDIYLYADQNLTRLVQRIPLSVTTAPITTDQNLRLEVGFSSGKGSDANKNLLNKTLTLIALKTEGANFSNSFEAINFAEAFLSEKLIKKYFNRHNEWIGKNEFEKVRTQKDFKSEVVEPLIAGAPSLPLKIDVVYTMYLENYDATHGGFPLRPSGKSGNSKNNYFERIKLLGVPEAWLLISGTMPDFLALPEVEAESLISDLQRRNIFLKAEITLKRFRNSSFEGEIDRLAFYTDAAVERMIVELPPPTVIDYMMDRDIPDKIEPKGSVELTTDTLALLLLRTYPEKIEVTSWNLLAQARMRYEQSLHKKEGEWFDYDPWIPYFPFNYNKKQLSEEEITGFFNWSKARAAGLSNHVIYRFKDEVPIRAGVPAPIFSSKKKDEENQEGIRYPLPMEKELVLMAPCKGVNSSNLVLPSDVKVIAPTLSREELGTASASVRLSVEVEIGEVEVTAGKNGCVIDVQGDPIAVEASLRDRVIRRIAVDRQVRNTAIETLSRQEAEQESADKEKEAEIEQQKRAAYEQAKKELDILGIHLGIPFADAEGIARQHLGQDVYVFTNPKHISTQSVQPLAILKNGKLFLNRDTGESIGIYGSAADGGEVIAVFRQMIFTEGIPFEAINDLLMEKYGSADSTLNNGRDLSWSPVKENLKNCSTSLTILGMNKWVSREGEEVYRLRKNEFPKNSNLPGICPLTLDCGVRLKADIETIMNSEKVRRLSLILIDSTCAVEISRQENERSEKKSLDNLPRL